jgi:hypothetical protein
MKQAFGISFGVVIGIAAGVVAVCCGGSYLMILSAQAAKASNKALTPPAPPRPTNLPMRETTIEDIKQALDSNEVFAIDTLKSNRWTVTFKVEAINDDNGGFSLGGDSGQFPYIICRFMFPPSQRSTAMMVTKGQSVTVVCDFQGRNRDLFTFDGCKLK